MKNWKTTVCGLAIAAVVAIQNYQGANTWHGYATAVLAALGGALCKDFNL